MKTTFKSYEEARFKAIEATNLNDNEIKVLFACMDAIVGATGCEFGCTDEVSVKGITKSQLKGYLSQLKQKQFIDLDNEFGQVTMTIAGCQALRFACNDDKTLTFLKGIEYQLESTEYAEDTIEEEESLKCVSVGIVVGSHLSDIAEGSAAGIMRRDEVHNRINFVKHLLFKYDDTRTKIDPDQEWREFTATVIQWMEITEEVKTPAEQADEAVSSITASQYHNKALECINEATACIRQAMNEGSEDDFHPMSDPKQELIDAIAAIMIESGISTEDIAESINQVK